MNKYLRFYLATVMLSFAFSTTGQAQPPTYFYSVKSFSCKGTNGLSFNYTQGSNRDMVLSNNRRLGARQEWIWIEGGRYFAETDTSELMITGHRPSAGPPYNRFESDYLVRFKKLLKPNVETAIKGEFFENPAFSGFKLRGPIECLVTIENNF